MVGLSYRPLRARVRVAAARRSCWGEPWIREASSHAPFFGCGVGHHPGLALRRRQGGFAEGRIG
jgi:hypothetical protein